MKTDLHTTMASASASASSKRNLAGIAVAAAIAALLAACGGGGDNPPTTPVAVVSPVVAPPPSVPASAVVDVNAFVGYLNGLAVNDGQEPLLADAVTPPTSDTGEPTTI